ncbi:MAG: cobyric acid synthase CobQ, partial [Kiloniellales bacterium]|nr:cobyric acid synthase CobQ [Kiloniellales bacterium]
NPIKVAVFKLARISNFDDFDPLVGEDDVELTFVSPGEALCGDADLVILPGSKATLSDLRFFYEQGWDTDLAAHVRRGGAVLGLCAGFQMLGQHVSDPAGDEGTSGSAPGLGYLDIWTILGGEKRLVECSGKDPISGEAIKGYEMHIGKTEGPGLKQPFLEVSGADEGAVSPDGRIMGCYIHGLFSADGFRTAFLSKFRQNRKTGISYDLEVESALDALAEHLELHLNLDEVLRIAKA